jgi:hypothetical protein
MYLVDMDEFFVMTMVRNSNMFGSIQVSGDLALLHTQNRQMKARPSPMKKIIPTPRGSTREKVVGHTVYARA